MNTQQQISRIQLIMGHSAFKTCLDCGFKYIPTNAITNHLCPKCQAQEIEEVKAGLLVQEIEEVNNDNADLVLFDFGIKLAPKTEKERIKKSKIGGKKKKGKTHTKKV